MRRRWHGLRRIPSSAAVVAASPHPAGRLRRLFAEHGVAIVAIAFGVVITVALRVQLLGYRSGDLYDCFLVWCEKIETLGFAEAYRTGGIDYNTPYVYLLWLTTKLPVERTLFLKLVPIYFDYLCAGAVAFIVYRIHRSALRAAIAAFALLVTPTVVFNSALWGQCDMVHTSLLVIALAMALKGRLDVATLLMGFAITVKLQAVFLFPLLGIWVARKALPVRTLVLIPLAFLICLLPAWAAGSSMSDLLMIYPKQMSQYGGLTVNAPTIFNLLPDEARWFSGFGVWFAMAMTFLVALACLYTRVVVTPILTIQQATVFACLVPFLLPHMHERYVFLGDVLTVLYACLVPRHFWIALLVVGASFSSYSSYLFSKTPVPPAIASLMLGTASLYLIFDLLRALYPTAFGAPKNHNLSEVRHA